MGRPLPGYTVALVDPLTGEPGEEGEICLDLARRPLGLMTGYRGDAERAAEAAVAILGYTRQRLSPYKRIRRLEFSELPKTISGKIRRVELRAQETNRLGQPGAAGRDPGAPARAAARNSGKRTSGASSSLAPLTAGGVDRVRPSLGWPPGCGQRTAATLD